MPDLRLKSVGYLASLDLLSRSWLLAACAITMKAQACQAGLAGATLCLSAAAG
ncbi:hypothetical protein EIO_3067 (plasmid) [Ketogulonicigenium vulgare Y25]|uniref:Uncharacterized protein n=1 Tax=Ketogulonicigenium vulgare (strain WSH-001) TaxID=759362 RepID=F9YBA6_KETVW|nr:hypothetical protein EIO_3067 [Ketogulonicigenium vulgare Y25]AEM42658.1 hypothetical protein KVU_PA0241 [Ketogulonicigenium vulgare WSH-001]ALJ82463.1 hypothetical protein KVH_14175 [Ketogulonicigenium vulgare]ANW35405.1 hypothetical protein KvSKV_14080 [Ketogulonicigenium vulgare]AOZ53359.1 hypothetical protein KVC_0333 [Ketogulonicigenium vulgare]